MSIHDAAFEAALDQYNHGMPLEDAVSQLSDVFGQDVAQMAIRNVAVYILHSREAARLMEQVEMTLDEFVDSTLGEEEPVSNPAKLKLGQPSGETIAAKCVICFEDETTSPVTLRCGHTFCHGCLTRWFEDHNTCPTCRENVDKKKKKRKRSRRSGHEPARQRRARRCSHCNQTGHDRRTCPLLQNNDLPVLI